MCRYAFGMRIVLISLEALLHAVKTSHEIPYRNASCIWGIFELVCKYYIMVKNFPWTMTSVFIPWLERIHMYELQNTTSMSLAHDIRYSNNAILKLWWTCWAVHSVQCNCKLRSRSFSFYTGTEIREPLHRSYLSSETAYSLDLRYRIIPHPVGFNLEPKSNNSVSVEAL